MKDLTKNRWKFVLIPALIVLAGIVLYIVHGGFNFDVEFMGGIRMQVNMHTDFDNKEVADLIQEKTVDTVSAKVQTVEKRYYGCYSSCNQRTYHGCDLCYNKHSA